MSNGPNRILDEFARLMTDAAGAAQGVRREMEAIFRTQAERILNSMDVVQREEFEAMRDMAVKARTDNASLTRKIDELEERIALLEASKATRKASEPHSSPGLKK